MASNTVFDDAYKTLIEKYPRLIIPVINEQFGRNYAENEPIENLSQEIQKPQGDIAADAIFKICDRMYHVECQSNPDGTIAVRMLEYDFYIAMRNVNRDEKGQYSIEFPKSAVLYLRHNSKTPRAMNVKVKVSEKLSFDYQVPIIKMQLYSLEKILEKKLYLLLPFYLLRYEKDVKKIETDDNVRQEVVEEYRELISILDREYDATDDTGRRLIREIEHQMKKLVEYVFEREYKSKNEIGGAIMGGTVMKTIDEELDEMRNEIEEKQRVIQENQRVIKEKEDAIKEKEDTIKEKEDAIKEKEVALAQALAEIERLKKAQENN